MGSGRKSIPNSALAIMAIAAILVVAWVIFSYLDATRWNAFIDEKGAITLTNWLSVTTALVTLVVSIIAVVVVYYRLEHQDDVVEMDNRFNVANALLGNSQTSARTGAIHSLYHLAVDSEKYRHQVAEILCAHIRSKTQESGYAEAHAEYPSDDVQATINVLFRSIKETDGLHIKFPDALPRASLHRAHLAGANFERAKCKWVVFGGTNCQKARFWEADCQNANFVESNCQGADFTGANCQSTYFDRADCQEAVFWTADCQRTQFWEANCQGVNFRGANCQWAKFWAANCEGADFQGADCENADFMDAKAEGAILSEEQRQNARHL